MVGGRPPGVEVMRVVRVTFLRGAGVESDPIREVTRYYDLDSVFLAEVDPAAPATNWAVPIQRFGIQTLEGAVSEEGSRTR